MENRKQPQQRDWTNKKPSTSIATLTTGVPGKKSSTNLPVSKGNPITIGARSKTLDLSKSSQTKSLKASTQGDLLNNLTTKNKVPYSPIYTSKKSPSSSKSSEKLKQSPFKNESAGSNISEKNRTKSPSLIPVRKTEEKKEQKRKSVKLDSLNSNTILSATSSKPDSKPNARTLNKDLDAKGGTTKFVERDLEEVLLNTPPVKSSAHSGITFMAKKKSSSPSKNIFMLLKDGFSNEDQPSNSSNQQIIENQALKPAQKTLQCSSKGENKEASEKTRSGKQFVAPTKKTVTTRADKETTSKMLRSKTELSISTNPRPGKPLHKVQSFSRLKPQPLIAKKPAHQAILDVTSLVKGESKVALPPSTSAHSGVPFKPKKPSTFAAVNIFAQFKDDTMKLLPKK